MEIVDVVNHTPQVSASSPVKVTFSITGLLIPFEFPFSNESLTDPMIQFIDQNNI